MVCKVELRFGANHDQRLLATAANDAIQQCFDNSLAGRWWTGGASWWDSGRKQHHKV